MTDVVIVEGVRTPVGVLGGALRDVPAQDLLKQVFAEVLRRTGIDPAQIDEVVGGCSFNPKKASNVIRVGALLAGVPKDAPGSTIDVNCGSALKALTFAHQAIRAGDGDVFLVGGTESMSNIPYALHNVRFRGYRFGNGELVDLLWEGLTDPVCGQLMGYTAENLVEEFGLTREDQDQLAFESHQKAIAAARSGKFDNEILPVRAAKKKGAEETVVLAQDEGPRADISLEKLGSLRPAFKEGGTVTAGNSCGINDGASAVLVMSHKKAKELGLKPRALIRSTAWVGLEPERMGLGPALALPKALSLAGLSLDDMGAFEINEAFAAQVLSCLKVLPIDRNKMNLHGGAIALGHAVGSTGTRLVVSLMNILDQHNLQYGAASLCVGGGLGGAIILERMN